MEKYMASWNTVSKQYVARLQKEMGPGGIASAAGGMGGL